MAASEMIQELIRAHADGNDQRFRTIALQLAAREARSGHRIVAGRIRDLLDEEPAADAEPGPTPIARPSEDLRAILATTYPKDRLRDIVLIGELGEIMPRLLTEHRSREELQRHGLAPRRRLLLHGPPGCGKTLAAQVIAGELGLPLQRVRIETIFSRYLGQTGAVLTQLFDEMRRARAVFLFDEFDALGRTRFSEHDVGEASRIVSTFLQLVDADESDAIIVAATNGVAHVDHAAFRRFDDVALLPLPQGPALRELLEMRTRSHKIGTAELTKIAKILEGASFAEADRSFVEALKSTVLDGRKRLRPTDLRAAAKRVRARSVTS